MTQARKTNEPNGLLRNLNLKTKATLIAIAIGVLPVTIIGAVSNFFVHQSLEVSVKDDAQARAKDLMGKLEQFLGERYGDIKVLANLPILRNERVKQVTTVPQRQQVLSDFAKTYGVYESITFMNLNGDDLLATGGAALTNHKDDDYFIAATTTGKPFISQPRFNKGAKQVVVFFSAPVKDSESGKIIGVVRASMPVKFLDAIASRRFENSTTTYHVIDKAGKVFLSNNTEAVANPEVEKHFPDFFKFRTNNQLALTEFFEPLGNRYVLATFVPWTVDSLPDLGWNVFTAIDEGEAFKAQTELFRVLVIGSILVAIATTLIAIQLVSRATKPIEEAAEAVEKIGKGQLDTRLAVSGKDELAVLGNNINLMTEQLGLLQKEQELELQRIEIARQEARADADASAQEQKTAKEKLQSRALELLMEVDPISQGDLTIRAKVTDDEIGTLADSYNSTVQSLRQIVVQVQATAQQVLDTTDLNEPLVQSLSQEALRQSEEIAIALARIQEMSKSIQAVATNAQKAEDVVQQASITLNEGDTAMNLTVDGISTIRTTVSETSDKVKLLGESTKNISRVVKLISNFAEQTNLLALNASIEAARAGVQGLGFAVVADEIQSLAQQSAEATTEITDLVSEIQIGTNEVVLAMEAGTKQVDIGTQLVEEARLKLTQIAAASENISLLVEAIAQATVEQSKSSEIVADTITDVAAIAVKTSMDTNKVSNAFKDLLEVAQKLQKSVGQFKV
jgi:twitching motility protein PilJ